ncbi:MAG: F0F1 ATP synthase subunit A [Gammaproteobacteria bacterium]|nr:F0F1 ATP synthase subunit A [Gammaproteobacteria bacterium]
MEPVGTLGHLVLHVGPVQLTGVILTTWIIMLALMLFAFFTRNLKLIGGSCQTILESAIIAAQNTIEAVLPRHAELVFPFITTLWVFILISNLSGLIPGVDSPTSDLSVSSGLAVLVFLSVHWFGIKSQGLKKYLYHYIKPTPIMLPFHIISEISRTLALAVRLFGNIFSLQLVAFFVLMIAGFLVPVPLLMLHIVEAIIQAYIFGMLALIYIAGGIQYQELKIEKEEGEKL